MSKKIWVFVEHRDNNIRKVALELLSAGKDWAKETGAEVSAVILGDAIEPLVQKLVPHAHNVYAISSPQLLHYTTDGYVPVLADLVKEHKPDILLTGATIMGKDLFARLSARLSTGLTTDCTNVTINPDGSMVIRRPIYGGQIFADVGFNSDRPQMATIRPNTFSIKDNAETLNGQIINIKPDINPESIRTKVVEVVKESKGKIDLTEAEYIVSAGRGIKAPENFRIIEELAAAMGAAVGASRAVVDNKWRPYDDQVGKSGKTVSPKLYIACGISGAIHHIMGMDSAKVIVVIDKDPNAIFFKYADYGIVDDLFKIVPLLTQEFKALARE